ncbi:hypothetical protein BKA70DRAFT_1226521 [Coprinopsis sp. MPI-PUGE-AT-0042]|nr:hypothetical protein BKA70DRAFT_1226513 [Coprinopsis sp. MPI-PUGE-AT-0042]KAH6904647.1 hypothetical protein BKA70DRAFT_1226521 [Coprinopsis sp. MPI-PUGE-AT-0042]
MHRGLIGSILLGKTPRHFTDPGIIRSNMIWSLWYCAVFGPARQRSNASRDGRVNGCGQREYCSQDVDPSSQRSSAHRSDIQAKRSVTLNREAVFPTSIRLLFLDGFCFGGVIISLALMGFLNPLSGMRLPRQRPAKVSILEAIFGTVAIKFDGDDGQREETNGYIPGTGLVSTNLVRIQKKKSRLCAPKWERTTPRSDYSELS